MITGREEVPPQSSDRLIVDPILTITALGASLLKGSEKKLKIRIQTSDDKMRKSELNN